MQYRVVKINMIFRIKNPWWDGVGSGGKHTTKLQPGF